jgi:hypothetical protein
MPANCPPPEPFLEVVTPGRALDDVLALDQAIESFGSDLTNEADKRPGLPGEWSPFVSQWRAWYQAWVKYKKDHDTWLENFDSAAVVRYVELRKCDLLDFRAKLRELGGKLTGPDPSFTQPSDALSNASKLVLLGIGAYVLVNVARKR